MVTNNMYFLVNMLYLYTKHTKKRVIHCMTGNILFSFNIFKVDVNVAYMLLL